ncbi:MAG TPA: DUF4301 domain-containing protein [Bacteroidales bacterium]|nr:MAG: NAD metabolism ATPase/kinase [Bacteroidetes bacterium GWF2_35_48]OFY92990.1 MAG: NAD metabolism ATPase/kinase [Bacteroidetes bacterium RIFOXYC12_FULL_35_7]HBX50193.1 DUF4301 domain-containing protein [Bacteroidales bacterium]
MFSKEDLSQIKERGIAVSDVESQIEKFKKGFPFLNIVKPASAGDGILKLNENTLKEFINVYENALPENKIIKFVPASGAATRMFKALFNFLEIYHGTGTEYADFITDRSFFSMFNFFENISTFAFYNDLKALFLEKGEDIEKILERQEYQKIIEFLLFPEGLNYANLPKGLIKFHKYDGFSRRPIGEHMVEGAQTCKLKDKTVHIHFTVSTEHKKNFKEICLKEKKFYESEYDSHFELSFSEQKSSTDTIAVDLQDKPFRNADGSLLFRPAGHGALIENLNDLEADAIFIKNIDNVVPDRLREQTNIYKKALAGLLFYYQNKIFSYLGYLDATPKLENEMLLEMIDFIKDGLFVALPDNFEKKSKADKIEFVREKLNRPIRVCGMVANEGEPGGGPFWVENADGTASLHILESSQIDQKNKKQKELWEKATHFNPVDLVCATKNYKGKKFNLQKFVDPKTGFISIKSKDGKDLKAMELPGLWNGAMSDWNTIFVEVPIITFNPVKAIWDLLRKEHQGFI